MATSGISQSFLGLSRSSGQVTHVLLTRSRLCPRPKPGSSLHLHVLGTPPAFVLSQDQTLREELLNRSLCKQPVLTKSRQGYSRMHTPKRGKRVKPLGLPLVGSGPCAIGEARGTRAEPPRKTGQSWHRRSRAESRSSGGVEPGHTPGRGSAEGAHAVEFSKTVHLVGKECFFPPVGAPEAGHLVRPSRRTDEYSA